MHSAPQKGGGNEPCDTTKNQRHVKKLTLLEKFTRPCQSLQIVLVCNDSINRDCDVLCSFDRHVLPLDQRLPWSKVRVLAGYMLYFSTNEPNVKQ